MQVGDFMLICGHISSFVPGPLIGPNQMNLATFPDMSEADKRICRKDRNYCKRVADSVERGRICADNRTEL